MIKHVGGILIETAVSTQNEARRPHSIHAGLLRQAFVCVACAGGAGRANQQWLVLAASGALAASGVLATTGFCPCELGASEERLTWANEELRKLRPMMSGGSRADELLVGCGADYHSPCHRSVRAWRW